MNGSKRLVVGGLNGSNPLGFLASLGLLRLTGARLGFLSDGSFQPYLDGYDGDLAGLVLDDAGKAIGTQPWHLSYEKVEKRGVKVVADLKAPPEVFRTFLVARVKDWLEGDDETAAYAAAFGTDVALDGKGNTKPTAFHFTAANQQFLGTVEQVRASLTREWIEESLFHGGAARRGSNLRWDPGAERNWALMAANPVGEGTQVDAPLEWLAFRALPLFPTFPRGARVVTTAVTGRGNAMAFSWPLWDAPASLGTVRSLLQLSWERPARGVFAVCASGIRRTSQGFGNFGPAGVRA